MSRGLGWVQQAYLRVIREYEASGDEERLWQWPTTFNIAATVYQIKPDADGNRWVNDAQHVAVKRALKNLQRKGCIIGLRDTHHIRGPGDWRIELAHIWMTETGLRRWQQRTAPSCAHCRAGTSPES
jgi:hypothetical protein